MTELWFRYLKQMGAQINGQEIIQFEKALQPLPDDSVADISHLGLLRVSGNDATQFLQGQFTNDVHQVTVKQSQLNAWCTPKGRVLVNFRLFQREADAYYLCLPQECLASILKRLKMYVLRAKVTLEEANEKLVRLGFIGTESCQQLSYYLNQPLPTSVHASLTHDKITVICIQTAPVRYLVLTEMDIAQKLWQQVTTVVNPVGSVLWQIADILAGFPQITPATADQFVPQMLNLQALGGVSFKKGCYTGQEIVARMQYLTALKQRLFLVQIEMTTLPKAGEILYQIDGEQIGTLINVQKHPEGYILALIVMPIELAEKETLALQQGVNLKVLDHSASKSL